MNAGIAVQNNIFLDTVQQGRVDDIDRIVKGLRISDRVFCSIECSCICCNHAALKNICIYALCCNTLLRHGADLNRREGNILCTI